MYNNFFGFDKKPFAINLETDFLFLREQHNAVLSSLKDGLSKQFGMMVVTGDMGTGKSILARSFLKQLDQHYTAALLPTTQYETLEEMLKNIFTAFELKDPLHNSTDLSNLLFENFLTTEFWKGKRVSIIIDDAHNLSVELLESIRLLSNFTINNKQIVQFILIGQKSLIDSLKIPELGQLIKSVSLFEELPPLSLEETHGYIHHCLIKAGGNKNKAFFTEKAFDSIYELSNGVPSMINHICELSLAIAYTEKTKSIGSEIIEAIANGKSSTAIKTDVQKTNQNKSKAILLSNKTTSITEKQVAFTTAESPIDPEDSNEITRAEKKSAKTIEIPESQPSKEINAPTSKEIPISKKSTSQKTAPSKMPNKWLVYTLVFLCITNIAFYLYSKNQKNSDDQIVKDTLHTRQNANTTSNNPKKVDTQLPRTISTLLSPPLLIEQNINLTSNKVASAGNVNKSHNGTSSKKSNVLVSQNKSHNDTKAVLNSNDTSAKINKKIDAPKVEKTKTAEQLLKEAKNSKKLLRIAKSQFSQMYLTTPKKYNAFETYKKILAIDPDFEPALKGIKNITNLYIYWAERDIKRRRYKQAKTFIKKGLLTAPNNTQLYILLDSVEQYTTR